MSASTRALALAAGVSIALHASLFVGDWSALISLDEGLESPSYEATLVAAPPPPAAVAAPKTRALQPLPPGAVAFLPNLPDAPAEPELAEAPEIAAPEASGETPPVVEPPPVVAMAAPSAAAAKPPVPSFREDALPGELRIRYTLSSSFAEGEAEYAWRREGERYEITGTARAMGFFAIFLEGAIDQRTSGRVTADGLRPEEFREWRPGAPAEGITFDWDARTVTQSRGGKEQVVPLEGNTIDWLSLVFQLAHQPPLEGATDLRVYTQRRLYTYRLDVVGEEEIDLPIGRVRALHIRHGAAGQPETVDVWLGIEQHYLPLKLRYPIARNRLVIEQTARSISFR